MGSHEDILVGSYEDINFSGILRIFLKYPHVSPLKYPHVSPLKYPLINPLK